MTEHIREIKDSSGALWSAAAQTATFNSEVLNISRCDRFGLILDMGTVSGTTPTLDIKVQVSLDDGSTWIDDYPDAVNSDTQASMAQITAQTDSVKFWDRFVPAEQTSSLPNNVAIEPRIRFVCTIGGTSPSFAFTKAWFVRVHYRS